MVEEIITALSRIRWLFVIARNSSFTYKGKAVDVKQVARELGVRYVLEGSVRKAGNRVRITGQLIDTTTGAHIWADRFDGALEDIFALQDQVASSVVGAIETKLRQSEIDRATRKPTEYQDAYDLYLRALAQFWKFRVKSWQEAVELLRRALAIDHSYAPAAGLFGWCRVLETGNRAVSTEEVAEAVRLARLAIEIGANDPDALWMGGWAILTLRGDRADAGRGRVHWPLLRAASGGDHWQLQRNAGTTTLTRSPCGLGRRPAQGRPAGRMTATLCLIAILAAATDHLTEM
jgi:tetratricopeptide (TPR) repeat protein